MDKKKGIANVGVSIAFKMILLIANILVRRFVIQYIGNEVNGLNSLYTSILDFLSVAELGVGSAITFCMYKPIVDGENDKVAALYHLFTKLYLIIGGIILAAGCVVMPFLKFLAKDYQDRGAYTVLDIVYGGESQADFITEPFEFKNSEGKTVSGERYLVRTVDKETGEVYQCAVKPVNRSDKDMLAMLMR